MHPCLQTASGIFMGLVRWAERSPSAAQQALQALDEDGSLERLPKRAVALLPTRARAAGRAGVGGKAAANSPLNCSLLIYR